MLLRYILFSMTRQVTIGFVFALLLSSCASQAASGATLSPQPSQQALTPAPNGPFHVQGNQIVDAKGRPYLMRGTQLTPFHPQTAARDAASANDVFGPHSATSLSAIRLRFNMNAVRLPLDITEAGGDGYFSALAKVVSLANRLDLLVILAAREPGSPLPSVQTAEFWTHCAAAFKDSPNVMFDVFSGPSPSAVNGDAHSAAGWNVWRAAMNSSVQAIRSTGAAQPIAVMSWNDDRLFQGAGAAPLIDDPNIIYEVSPSYAANGTDAGRDAHFGFLANRAPVFATGWDLNLDDAADCASVPADPAAASQLVQGNLDYFDAHRISWTVSVFEPGKLIKDLSFHDATTLENGWTCGHPLYPYAGLGRVVEGHLRASQERGLFVVSASGGPDLARGGFALAYGPVMAERDSIMVGTRPAATLGRLSVQITDSLGVTRPTGVMWASAGWGQINFLIPEKSALGPARMTIVREDGSRTGANITIGETAPGFVTGHSCRGPAIGVATSKSRNGRTTTAEISSCKGIRCATNQIPMASGATTTVRLDSSGFRYAGSAADIEVTIGGVRVPVVSFGPADGPGKDQLTIEIPAALRGIGETDLLCHLNGRVSNAVLVRL